MIKFETTLAEEYLQTYMDKVLTEIVKKHLNDAMDDWRFRDNVKSKIYQAANNRLETIIDDVVKDLPELEAQVRKSIVTRLTSRIMREVS